MKTIKRGRWARPVSWLTMLAWLALPVLPMAPAPAQITPPPSLAVVQVVNQSGSSVQNLGARAAVAINERFASSGKYTVLGQAAVDGAIQGAGATLPLRADVRDATLLRIAQSLQADYLVLATIDSVECDAGQKLAVVKSRVQVFGRQAEGDVTEANITAFNLDKSTSEAMLIDDALEQNAMGAVREVTHQLGARGKVIARPIESSVRVSFDERDMIRLGDRLVVLRNGLRTAVLEVAAIHASDAECKVVERSHPELQIGINDDVVLYRKGTGRAAADNPDFDPNKEVHTAPERSRNNQNVLIGALIGVAALAAGAWLITRSDKKRDDDRTARLVSPPNGATVQVDINNQLVTPLSFATTTALSVASATFQLAGDTGFTQLMRSETQAGTAATRQAGGQQQGTQEPAFTFIFTPSQEQAFVPPGAYFWRVVMISGTKAHTSNTFQLNVVRQGGGGAAALGSPATLRAIPGDTTVEVQWSPVAGATGYQIFRRTLPPAVGGAAGRARTWTSPTGANAWLRGAGRRSPRTDRRGLRDVGGAPTRQAEVVGFSFLGALNSNTLNFTDTTVKNGTTYEWAVLTINGDGVVTTLNNAVAQGVVSATPISNGPPAVPANLVAVAGDGQVSLTWTLNPADDIAGYQVFRAPSANANFDEIVDTSFRNLVTDAGSPSALALSAGPNDNVVVDRGGPTGLSNGTAVFYRIRAVKLATLQPGQPIDLLHDPRLVSPLSDVATATPSTAPPRELEVVQPAANSLVDTDLPLLSWRGVTGTPQYTVQLDTLNTFDSPALVQASTTETQLIYPAASPPLLSGLTYFIRVGVLDNVTQALRFGPTSQFRRGDVTRYTVTVTSHRQGEAVEFLGASISIDGAVTGKLTRAQFVLNTGQTYHLSATFYAVDGTLYNGSTDVTPPLANSTVDLELVPDARGLAPAAPTGLSAIGQTDRIVLRWNPDPNLPEVGLPGTVVADNYSIRRRENTAEGAFAEIAVLDAPATAGVGSPQQLIFTDFNVTAGQRYFYQILARSVTGVPSIASVIADAVPGVGVIQVVSPQDNQTFEVAVGDARKAWTLTLHFAWTQVPQAARYIFEIGRDPNLHNLLENGNAVLAAPSDTVTYTIGDSLPPDEAGIRGPYFDRDLAGGTLQTLYWRVIAVDDQNRIINQTEARRLFFTEPGVIAAIPVGP